MINKKIIALGIDQGIANLGYCVLAISKENKSLPEVLKSGVFETTNARSLQDRIKYLYDNLDNLMKEYPDIVIIGTESLFVNSFQPGGRNKSAAIVSTNMITGAILLLGANHGVLVKQYTPGTVKKFVTGVGDATKLSVEIALDNVIQKNQVDIKADHQSDAIALAWTSAINVMETGLDALTEECSAARKPKRKSKPKIIQLKPFLFHGCDVEPAQKGNRIVHYLSRLELSRLEALRGEAIQGQFKKGEILLATSGEDGLPIKIGVEVGKKAKCASEYIPGGTWFTGEFKEVEEKNFNRSYLSLLRKLAKYPDYRHPTGGRVLEVLTGKEGDKYNVQFYIELEITKKDA